MCICSFLLPTHLFDPQVFHCVKSMVFYIRYIRNVHICTYIYIYACLYVYIYKHNVKYIFILALYVIHIYIIYQYHILRLVLYYVKYIHYKS